MITNTVGYHKVTEPVTRRLHNCYTDGTNNTNVEHIERTRRSVLAAGSTLALVGLTGCIGDDDSDDDGGNGSSSGNGNGASDGTGDDAGQTDDSADGADGATLSFEGQLDGFGGEEGEISPDYIHTGSLLNAGYLESDGTFAVTIEESDLEPEDEDDFGDPVTLLDSLNLRCNADVNAQIDDDARFTWFTHLRVADIDREEVSFITAMTDPDGCEPSFANCPNAEAEYVTWVYTTHDVDVAVDCDDESIDVNLTAGWNVVLQDEYTRNDQSTTSIDSLETAFETVSWYYNDQ